MPVGTDGQISPWPVICVFHMEIRKCMTAGVGRGQGVEGLSKKKKEGLNMDNSVLIAGGKGYKGTKYNGKNTIQIK